MASSLSSSTNPDRQFSFEDAHGFPNSLWNPPAFDRAPGANLSKPVREDGNCLLAVALAVGIESAIAFSIYAAWHIWLTLR